MKSSLKWMLSLFAFLLVFLLPPKMAMAERPILTIDTGGHMGRIQDVFFTSDGRYLVSASDDKTIRVWDTSTGEIARVFRGQIGEGHKGKIFAAALSPDDRLLAVGGLLPGTREESDAIRIIKFSTGEVTNLLKGHTNVINDLAFSPDGNWLISGSADKTARIWDLCTQKLIHVLRGHKEAIYAVAFSPEGKRAVTGSHDDTLKIWNADSGSLIKTLRGHEGDVVTIAFTPNGKYLLSGSKDKTIRLWEGSSENFVKVLARQKTQVLGLSISPDSTKLLTGHGSFGRQMKKISDKPTSYVFSIPSGKRITSFFKHENIVKATDISPDGTIAATGGGENFEIYLWDLSKGKVVKELVGKGRKIYSVGFANDGRSIAWGKTINVQRDVFYYGPLEQSFYIKGEKRGLDLSLGHSLDGDNGYQRAIESVGPFFIDIKNRASYPKFQILREGKKFKKEIHKTISKREGAHRSLTMTPDGKAVVSGGDWGIIASYDLQTGNKIYDFIGHTDMVNSISASPDSRLLVSGSGDQTVKLWDIKTGKLLLSIFHGTDNEWIAWTPDGYYTSSLHGDKYIGWHLNNGEDKAADYYSAFQFERILYRPDYVHAYLQYGGDREKVESLLGGDFFDIKNLRDIAPPKITIISPSYGDTLSTSPHATIKFSVESTSIAMLDYSIFVNQIPVIPSKERILEHSEKRSFARDVEIPLFAKKNRIRIEVFNGKSMGIAETVVYKKGVASKPTKGDLYLLTVGVNEFRDMPSNNLEYATSDAENFAKFFRLHEGEFYDNVLVKVISDVSENKPSKENVLKSLDFIKQARAEDTVVVFLASHGLSDQAGNYYFVPNDAKVEDVNRLVEASGREAPVSLLKLPSLVSWESFFQALRSVAGRRLLIVDTCQAKNISGTLDIHSLAKRSATSSFALLAASRGNEESQEYPPGKQGLFTYALLRGLSGEGDINGDGLIVLSELYDFSAKFVEKNRSKDIGKQTPQLTAPRELRGMVLATCEK